MAIFTKQGDFGKSAILGNKSILKDDPVFEVLGTLDELNAALGIIQLTKSRDIQKIIYELQIDLFSIGAHFAGDTRQRQKVDFVGRTNELEEIINSFDSTLSELRNFILPGGSIPASQLHLCRALCRRLERNIVLYLHKKGEIDQNQDILAFINRMSDLLFVLARSVNQKLGVSDVIWEG